MLRLLLSSVLILAVSGCVGQNLQGTQRVFTATLELPARAVQGANRNPFSCPTFKQAFDRLPSDYQLKAAIQGTKKDIDNAVVGLE